ncbi:uncharacterized protein [Atheta coriaria]|uniref:uncharacterized protein n=1 Tax=Dalotia coriaria TaxID=877792 RepID=UPI0031F41447
MAEIPHSILEVAFLAISAISQQGPEKEPIGMHGKTVTWFLFLAFMFLYAAYSASIFALLQATSSEIQSIEDLLKSPLHVGFHDSSFMRRIIPNIIGDERLQILEKSGINKMNNFDFSKFISRNDGIKRVQTELFAFHIETHIGYTLIEETFEEVEKCNLEEIQFLQFPTDLYFAIKKKSPLFEMFKIGFLILRERGIHHRESTLLHTPKPRCWTLDRNFDSVGILDCYFALTLFAGGVILSLIILLIELVMAKIKL